MYLYLSIYVYMYVLYIYIYTYSYVCRLLIHRSYQSLFKVISSSPLTQKNALWVCKKQPNWLLQLRKS